MRCAPLSYGYILNCIAFRANTGMPSAEFTMLNALELHETRLVNGSERRSDQRQGQTTLTHWINHRRVRSTLSP